MIDLEQLRKVGTAVYLAAEKEVAEDIAKHIMDAADEIERLRASQMPDEVTPEIEDAIYELKLGTNRLSQEDVIDIYDTIRCVVRRLCKVCRRSDCADSSHQQQR